MLFRAEDDRFEWDIYTGRVTELIEHLRRLQQKISTLPLTEQSKVKLADGDLLALHKVALTNVYQPRDEEVIKLLMAHPAASIPVIMARLVAKNEEWAKLKLVRLPFHPLPYLLLL